MKSLGFAYWMNGFRLSAAIASLAVCVFLGCGNMEGGGGGCDFTAGNGNENENANVNDNDDNDNGGTANDNEPGGNDNSSNDNDGGNVNDNTAGNDNSSSNDNTAGNGNDNTTGNQNDNTAGNDNSGDNTNDNTAGNGNSNDNTTGNQNDNTPPGGGGGGGGGGGTPTSVQTKSSGAAVPGSLVVLSLNEDLPNACEAAAVWSQTGGPMVDNLVHQGDGSARFTTPTQDQIPTTMNLTFVVNIPASCSVGARTGTITVPVQVANLVFDLPGTLALNAPLNLVDFTAVNGAPSDFLVLYFSQEPLPDGVVLDINQFTSTLTVTAGVGQPIRITVQVFAAAGLLAEASDVIQVVASQ
jgi:hypothetical protein